MYRSHKHFTEEELTRKCTECGTITKQGTSIDPDAVSHGLCHDCVPMLMKNITIDIEYPYVRLNGEIKIVSVDSQRTILNV